MEIKDVENLAELARLALSEEEKKEMLKDLGSVLEYVKIIQEADVAGLEVEHEIYNTWREDLPAQTGEARKFSKELITSQFPDSQDGFLKVKKIL